MGGISKYLVCNIWFLLLSLFGPLWSRTHRLHQWTDFDNLCHMRSSSASNSILTIIFSVITTYQPYFSVSEMTFKGY